MKALGVFVAFKLPVVAVLPLRALIYSKPYTWSVA